LYASEVNFIEGFVLGKIVSGRAKETLSFIPLLFEISVESFVMKRKFALQSV
jgi:hypothetical protein